MKKWLPLFCIVIASCALFSCAKDSLAPFSERGTLVKPESRGGTSSLRYSHVLILYSEGYNNLMTSLDGNIDAVCEGYVPTSASDKALVVFSHGSATNYDYSTPTSPVLYRIYKEGSQAVRDTLLVYPSGSVSVDVDFMRGVLSEIRSRFPSTSYGMLYSSHGTGWLPKTYTSMENRGWTFSAEASEQSIGAQYPPKDCLSLDIDEFASAVPFKLDYIIADACLMGGVEVLYQWRDICERLVASPGEILSEGIDYAHLTSRLLEGDTPDLEAVCEDFYHLYADKGSYVTVAMYDCTKADLLVEPCRAIFAAHRDEIASLDPDSVQGFNYSYDVHFDFRDVLVQLGSSEQELEAVDAALSEAVIYKKSSEKFFSNTIRSYSGLSMFIPSTDRWPRLTESYASVLWNIDTQYTQ